MALQEPRPGRRASPPRVTPPKFPTAGKAGGNGAWTRKRPKQRGKLAHTADKKEVLHSTTTQEGLEFEFPSAPLEVRPGRIMNMTPEAKVERQHLFLQAFLEYGTIAAGCRAAEINRRTYYRWIDDPNDRNFFEAMEDSTETVADDLEQSALTRAKDKSDILAIFLLKGMRHKYRDNFKGNGSNGKPEEEEEKERTASSIVRSKLDALKRKKGGSGLTPEGLQAQVQQARLRGKVRTDEDDDSDIIGEDDD